MPSDWPASCREEEKKKLFNPSLIIYSPSFFHALLGGFYLAAEVSDATNLKGAGGLTILHLQVHGGPHTFGHADALQQRCVYVEEVGHGAPAPTKRAKTKCKF